MSKSNFVLRSYISGVQQYLNDAGYVKYASEGAAEVDNAALAAGLENKIPAVLEGAGAPPVALNNEAIATEGMAPELNATVAKAVAEMAHQVGEDAEIAKAKAEIIENAAVEMASNEKVASVLIVAGQGKGTPAAETVTGKDDEIASQVPTDATRTSERVKPGTEADAGKGMMGVETKGEKPVVTPAPTMEEKLTNQIDNDANRVHPTTAPGKEEDAGKGMMGEEVVREKVSHILEALNI